MRRNDEISINIGRGWGVALKDGEVIFYIKYRGKLYGVIVDPDTVRDDMLIAEECVKMPPNGSLALN